MKHADYPAAARKGRQRGLTVIELMVAMALGLVVLLATGSLLISSTRAHAALVETAEMDDSGRYAMDALARAVRKAAHVDWEFSPEPDPEAPARIAGFDATSLSRTDPGVDVLLPDAANGSDVLALRFPGSGNAPDGDGATLDCAGFPVNREEEGWSIFYVARNAQGAVELRCKYRGHSNWSSDAVAGGVDSFQVLYGLDTDEDGTPDRYVNASELQALDAGLVLTGAAPDARAAELRRRTHWKRVATVRVALLLHGPRTDGSLGGAIVHDLFGPDYGAAFAQTDRGTRLSEMALAGRAREIRMRKVYEVTVALPAMLAPAPAGATPEPESPEPQEPTDPPVALR
jgi:type IV pilus assembly protein PilW